MSNFTFSGKYSWTPIVSEHVGPFRCHFSKSRQQFLLNVYKQKPPAPLKGGFSHNGNISIIHSSTKKGFSSIWHYVYPYDIQYKTLGTNTHMYQTNILYPNTPLKCVWSPSVGQYVPAPVCQLLIKENLLWCHWEMYQNFSVPLHS